MDRRAEGSLDYAQMMQKNQVLVEETPEEKVAREEAIQKRKNAQLQELQR